MRLALWLTILTLALAFGGCKASSPTPYVSPRVTGRVIDSQTRQPIKGVKVRRATLGQESDPQSAKGAEVMGKAPAIRTAADGTFLLASERSLSPFLRGGWYSVSIAFEHTEYIRYRTNYSLKHAILTPKGEPVVNAGDIPLARKSP
jgi:hypothetical protein